MNRTTISWVIGILLVAAALLSVYLAFSASKRAPPPPPPPPPPVVDKIPPGAAPPPKRPGRLDPEPRSLRLSLGVGETTKGRIAFRNTGEEPVAIESIRLIGSGFVIDRESCPGRLDAGELCQIIVGYGPAPQAGVAESELVAVNNGLDRVVQVPLIAVATSPEAVGDPLAEARRLLREARSDGSRPLSIARPETAALPSSRDRQSDYGAGFPKAEASLPVDLERVILAGSFIEATLETPINTAQPGPVSAVVSRSVYSRHGRAALLPRGSRLLGAYQSLQAQGAARVVVAWQRIVRPDGAHVLLQAPGADAMGRIGVIGEVDNRLWERFGIALTSAVLTGALDIGAAFATPPGQRTTTVGPGGTTLSVTEDQRAGAIRDATRNSVNRIGDALRDAIKGQVDVRPVATIARGSRVYAIPTVDLWFRPVTALVEEAVPLPGAVPGMPMSIGTPLQDATTQLPGVPPASIPR